MSVDRGFSIDSTENLEKELFGKEYDKLLIDVLKQSIDKKITEEKIINLLAKADINIIFDEKGKGTATLDGNDPIISELFELLDNMLSKEVIKDAFRDVLTSEDLMLKYIVLLFKKYNNTEVTITGIEVKDKTKKAD